MAASGAASLATGAYRRPGCSPGGSKEAQLRLTRLTLAVALTLTAAFAGHADAATSAAAPDPAMRWQWGLTQIGAPVAWDRTEGAGIRIGIVDSGIDLQHEDLAGRIVADTNCIGAGGEALRCRGRGRDGFGHGTHVAGIAAAARNGKGIVGVAPAADLVVAKTLDASGGGTIEDVVAGVKWAVDHGARVINLSLGNEIDMVTSVVGTPYSLRDAIDYAWERGAVPVIAVGNSNLLGLGAEGSYYNDLNAVMVGATEAEDKVANYSSATGAAKWAVLAPGGAGKTEHFNDILSTWWTSSEPNTYLYNSGTSMAAAHVSGAVALLLAEGYSQIGAVRRLLDTADESVSCTRNSPTCRGRIDIGLASRPSFG
jgi:subtilisin family serine protease